MKNIIANLNIQQKLFLIPAIVVGIVFAAWGGYSAYNQGREMEHEYTVQLELLSHTSTAMSHSSAEALAEEKGWRYHRVLIGTEFDSTAIGRAERMALDTLRTDAAREFYETRIVTDTGNYLAVFVPARIESECGNCHNPTGVDIFSDKKEGDLVAVFGVSGSLAPLAEKKAALAWETFIISALCIVVIVLAIRAATLRIVVQPVKEIVMQSQKIAHGDLTYTDTPFLQKRAESADEIGQLSRAFVQMLGSLRSMIVQLMDSSSSVVMSSSQISSSSEEIAAGTFQQTNHVNEISDAIHQMTESIRENSQNAAQTAATAQSARDAAVNGADLVQKTIAGMRRIETVTQQTAGTVNMLEKSSDQINEIISVIEGIANQTNLLALNAAIEAARAGDHGRGFAVVADEVKKLSERTTASTKEISDMIVRIQKDTKEAVRSMQEGVREVNNGIQLAEQAGTALNTIKTISEQMSVMVQMITDASQVQTGNAEVMSGNVQSISTMTSETASGIQQIAQSLEQLNALTSTLQAIVNRFAMDDHALEMARSKETVRTPTPEEEELELAERS